MKANGVIHLQIINSGHGRMTMSNFNNNYVGFFGCELKTCDTIEEGVKSFDKKKKVKVEKTD